MTDDRKADDAWIDALEGKPADAADNGTHEAHLIRAAIRAQDELTSERISDEDVRIARQKLMARLGSEDGPVEASEDSAAEQSTVVDLSARRPRQAPRSIWRQNPGVLLAASVAFVAIVVMMLRDPNIPDGPALLMSYGEVEILRGAGNETVYPVDDPDAFGRDLGGRLIEREIPFTLTAETPDSPDRTVTIQVDGVPNAAGVGDTLDELGLPMPSTSVLILRLVPE